MSEDAILDALDRMITGFKPQEADEWAPSRHLKTQVPSENPSIPAAVVTVGTVGTEKQALYGEEGNNDHHDASPSSNFSKNSRESSIGFVTGAHGAHSAHSRTNPDVLSDRVLARDECRWHLDHGERVPRELCAGCRRPIASGDDVLDLADDNRVHFDADYRCLIAFGERWRSAARAALARPEGA